MNCGSQKKDALMFCGGGSGGHVIPALTLLDEIRKKSRFIEFHYIGSPVGIERKLTENASVIYHSVSSGKLRRKFTFSHITEFLKFFKGLCFSFFLIKNMKKKYRRVLLFATGGFVSVAPVIAARLNGITTFIHEQTSKAGLANRISAVWADKVFISFPDSKFYFPKNKTILSGYPLRERVYQLKNTLYKLQKDHDILNHLLNHFFYKDTVLKEFFQKASQTGKPVLLITGGGNGSGLLNDLIKKELGMFLQKFMLIHQVGKNFIADFKPLQKDGYCVREYLNDIPAVMALSSLVISRSGAGTVSEMIALQKEGIMIPLKIAQKNEQFYNARYASKKINIKIIEENEFNENFSLYKFLTGHFPRTSFFSTNDHGSGGSRSHQDVDLNDKEITSDNIPPRPEIFLSNEILSVFY